MVRGLYQEPIEVRSQLKQFMTTNELPTIKSTDGGTWRRIRVIEFLSKFVENPDPENPYEFKLDDTLKEKINSWAGAFASYLINIYTTMYDIDNKLPEPAEVMTATNEYRREQDIFSEYFDCNIEITSEKVYIKRRELTNHFKLWVKNDKEHITTLPKTKTFTDYVEKTLKIKFSTNYGYIGIKFKSDDSSSGEQKPSDLDY
jgi:phage/plasmid-associated DNA primase